MKLEFYYESCANAATGDATLGLNAREQLTKCIELMKEVRERNQEFEKMKGRIGSLILIYALSDIKQTDALLSNSYSILLFFNIESFITML